MHVTKNAKLSTYHCIMKLHKSLIAISSVLILASCETAEISHETAKSLVYNCYSCHSPNASEASRIAPSMAEVKTAYLAIYGSKKAANNAMNAFVNSPSSEKVVMGEAMERFGIMPNMQYEKTDLQHIVSYIFSNQIDSREWLSQYNSGASSEPKIDKSDYSKLGRHIVMSTKKILGKNLKGAIKSQGTEYALDFCNTRAIPLTDSMGVVLDATITRVSDRNRNPDNAASPEEVDFIEMYSTLIASNRDLSPILKGGTFYMPIVTNEMCLQCHGSGDEVSNGVRTGLDKLYPEDLALGYGVNEIRGIWRVDFGTYAN